jgi:UDP-glucose 4-epimerase
LKILIVGGAGYIGSHMLTVLNNTANEIVTLDNLMHGHRDAVLFGDFIEADLKDKDALDGVLSNGKFDAVMHFASLISVEESSYNPSEHYENNVVNTLNLLNSMVKNNVKYIIFSSSAAIFGNPDYTPIDENHSTIPVNPYGQTKLIVENILANYDQAYGLKSVCLRYFNVAGAHPEGLLGERHITETHLIPLVLQVASGRRKSISIFGRDYDTNDGTCIRDYIHVMDLCDAHLLALNNLVLTNVSSIYNLGNDKGFSVQDVIKSASHVTGKRISVIDKSRRAGDVAILIASSSKAKKILGWAPRFNNLNIIIEHAWAWEKKSH